MSGDLHLGRHAADGRAPSRRGPEAISRVVARFLKREATDDGAYAGAVLLVAQGDDVIAHEAHGYAELFDAHARRIPEPRPMHVDTLFDLASITKVAATTTLLALLWQDGEVAVTDAISTYLPAFARDDKRDITLADALGHASGLAPWLPFYLYVDSPAEAFDLIAELPTAFPRGHMRMYSDVNFMVLGRIVEIVTGMPLDRAAHDLVFAPLRLSDTGYRPRGDGPRGDGSRDIVATSLGNRMEAQMCATRTFPRPPPRRPEDLPEWRRHVLVGEVNDFNCHRVFGGVSGHAGLFSTAWDLARFGRAMLDPLTRGREPLLRRDTMEFFATPKAVPGQGLGWWCRRVDASPRTFGHRGFVGTQLFLDPDHDLAVVLLTNRVHGALPYADPARYSEPIVEAVYRTLGIAPQARVDPWAPPASGAAG